ncbi:hypothetical protein EV561_1429 [Rhizobium sp. BK376]|nr:hypothetical protein EV561_1429 [Rhizobium sp. BK376]
MIEWKEPHLLRRFVKMAKKPSIALSLDVDVGVKWTVKRGRRARRRSGHRRFREK